MEGRRYSLRSGGVSSVGRQTKLEFPCRRSSRSAVKRRQGASTRDEGRGAADENESPPKRSRVTGNGHTHTTYAWPARQFSTGYKRCALVLRAAMKKLTLTQHNHMVASRCSDEVFLLVKHKHTQKHFLCLLFNRKAGIGGESVGLSSSTSLHAHQVTTEGNQSDWYHGSCDDRTQVR